MGTDNLAAVCDESDTRPNRASYDDQMAVPHSSVLPQPRRLFLLAVLLPAFVAVSNQLLFNAVADLVWARAWLYPWLAFTTLLFSWCIGRYLDPAWLRVMVFGWCWALLDVLTIAACLSGPIPGQVGFALVSAQISFITVCAVLGPWGWQWRLPAALVAAAVIITFSTSFMDRWSASSWNILMTLVTSIVVALCIGLRTLRFTLSQSARTGAPSAVSSGIHATQFGLKHMLVWATAVAPVLLLVRGVDAFALEILGLGGIFSVVLPTISLATLNLVVIWAVLGGGPWIVRLAALPLTAQLIAVGLSIYSARVETQYGRWNGPPLIDTLIEMRPLWMSWIWLDVVLIAALLLFLREIGYRLVRLAR